MNNPTTIEGWNELLDEMEEVHVRCTKVHIANRLLEVGNVYKVTHAISLDNGIRIVIEDENYNANMVVDPDDFALIDLCMNEITISNPNGDITVKCDRAEGHFGLHHHIERYEGGYFKWKLAWDDTGE